MKFENISLTLNSVATVFVPHEITENGAYVWVEQGKRSYKALRFVITPTPSRDGKVLDRVNVSVQAPHIASCETGCGTEEKVMYTELQALTARFNPESSGSAGRIVQADALKALLSNAGIRALFVTGDLITR